jgi:hypothetical protein
MVEVFKTDVTKKEQAELLIDKIQRTFADHKANFDLGDCDKILRVNCAAGHVQPSSIINTLKDLGFNAEVLPDELSELLLGEYQPSGSFVFR